MNYFSIQEERMEDQGQGSGMHPEKAATKDNEQLQNKETNNFKLGWERVAYTVKSTREKEKEQIIINMRDCC